MRALSIALLLISGGAGILGGGSMLIDPSGISLGLSADLLDKIPFTDYFIPGLVLFLVVGSLGILTGILTVVNSKYAALLTILQGIVLTACITVQVFMLQEMEFIQVVVGGTGFALFCLGLLQADEDAAVNENDFAD